MSDREEKSIKQQLEELKLEKEKLELEALREQVESIRAKKLEAARKRDQQIATLKQAEADMKARQAICNHRKGGKNLAGIVKGNASDYATVHHQYATGEVQVICTRCQKEWKPGDPEYAEALQWPTDNEPSGGVLFGIPRKSA